MKISFVEELRKYNQVYREMDAFYHMQATRNGLSDSAYWILYSICEDGDGCSQKELCDKLSASKQTIHSAIRKLELEGFLYLSAGKGRDKNIYLTDAGKLLIEKAILPVIAIENETFINMGEDEARELQRLTGRYASLLLETYESKMQSKKGDD